MGRIIFQRIQVALLYSSFHSWYLLNVFHRIVSFSFLNSRVEKENLIFLILEDFDFVVLQFICLFDFIVLIARRFKSVSLPLNIFVQRGITHSIFLFIKILLSYLRNLFATNLFVFCCWITIGGNFRKEIFIIQPSVSYENI